MGPYRRSQVEVLRRSPHSGNDATMAYDPNGSRLSVRGANGVGLDCIYDNANRGITCTDTAEPAPVSWGPR